MGAGGIPPLHSTPSTRNAWETPSSHPATTDRWPIDASPHAAPTASSAPNISRSGAARKLACSPCSTPQNCPRLAEPHCTTNSTTSESHSGDQNNDRARQGGQPLHRPSPARSDAATADRPPRTEPTADSPNPSADEKHRSATPPCTAPQRYFRNGTPPSPTHNSPVATRRDRTANHRPARRTRQKVQRERSTTPTNRRRRHRDRYPPPREHCTTRSTCRSRQCHATEPPTLALRRTSPNWSRQSNWWWRPVASMSDNARTRFSWEFPSLRCPVLAGGVDRLLN